MFSFFLGEYCIFLKGLESTLKHITDTDILVKENNSQICFTKKIVKYA